MLPDLSRAQLVRKVIQGAPPGVRHREEALQRKRLQPGEVGTGGEHPARGTGLEAEVPNISVPSVAPGARVDRPATTEFDERSVEGDEKPEGFEFEVLPDDDGSGAVDDD